MSIDNTAPMEEDAKKALREFLDANYNVPPVNKNCMTPEAISEVVKTSPLEDQSVGVATCPNEDKCVKILVGNSGLNFVIRGCQSWVYKLQTKLEPTSECVAGKSPAICFCQKDLCNSQHHTNPYFSLLKFCIALYMSYINFY